MGSPAVSLNLLVKNPDEDYAFVESALAGSSEAFKELFTRNVSRVYSLCLRISADKFAAEELTQESFIKAWEKLDTFRFESKFSTWLHSIAVNQSLMRARADQRTEKFEETGPHIKGSHIAGRYDSKIDIENAIQKLPPQARMVLVLHDIEGYKHNEISEMMNIQIGTSKAHLHRARKILREELGK